MFVEINEGAEERGKLYIKLYIDEFALIIMQVNKLIWKMENKRGN